MISSDRKIELVIDKDLNDIDCLILAGGLGTRLNSLSIDKPKVLLPINNKPFIDILIDKLTYFGIRNFIICVGYKKDQIIEHFNRYNYGCIIRFSEEEIPLGTGGAVKNAKPLINSDNFLVLNGDSFCNINLKEFYDYHIDKNALVTIANSQNDDNSKDYGNITLNSDNKIISFNEKSSDHNLISAGIYLMKKEIFNLFPKLTSFSLEYDLFPRLCNYNVYKNRCFGYMTNKKVIDIGTPDRYIKANEVLKLNEDEMTI